MLGTLHDQNRTPSNTNTAKFGAISHLEHMQAEQKSRLAQQKYVANFNQNSSYDVKEPTAEQWQEINAVNILGP